MHTHYNWQLGTHKQTNKQRHTYRQLHSFTLFKIANLLFVYTTTALCGCCVYCSGCIKCSTNKNKQTSEEQLKALMGISHTFSKCIWLAALLSALAFLLNFVLLCTYKNVSHLSTPKYLRHVESVESVDSLWYSKHIVINLHAKCVCVRGVWVHGFLFFFFAAAATAGNS